MSLTRGVPVGAAVLLLNTLVAGVGGLYAACRSVPSVTLAAIGFAVALAAWHLWTARRAAREPEKDARNRQNHKRVHVLCWPAEGPPGALGQEARTGGTLPRPARGPTLQSGRPLAGTRQTATTWRVRAVLPWRTMRRRPHDTTWPDPAAWSAGCRSPLGGSVPGRGGNADPFTLWGSLQTHTRHLSYSTVL